MAVVRHPPPKLATARPSDIYLSSRTPFVAAIRRTLKALRQRRGKYVRVYGTGKAIQRALSLGAEFQSRGHRVDLRTSTLWALDETINEEEGTASMERRPVGSIEIQIFPCV